MGSGQARTEHRRRAKGRRVKRLALLALGVVILAAAGYRYLHTMPVGTGETRASPDGRFTASVTDWSERGFLTGTPHRWFQYRVDGPGVAHDLVGHPVDGPYFGSRSNHQVIRWSEDGSFVEFAFPDTVLRLTVAAWGPCRLAADLSSFDVERTADGLRLRPLGWQHARNVAEMDVRFLPADQASGDLTLQRRVGADMVRYDLVRQSGGSGGDEFTLRAERPIGTHVLRLEWREQSEDGAEPDLEQAFALMASAECEK